MNQPAFFIRIRNRQLTARTGHPETGPVLFSIDISVTPTHFYRHQDALYLRHGEYKGTCLYTGPGAQALLTRVVSAIEAESVQQDPATSSPSACAGKRGLPGWLLPALAGAGLMALLLTTLHPSPASVNITLQQAVPGEVERTVQDNRGLPALPQNEPAPVPVPARAPHRTPPEQATGSEPALTGETPEARPAIAQPVTPASAPASPTAWQGTQQALATLAQNLKKATDRQLFTVPLSQGHARTLYVFADPLCPHCREFEPALDAISQRYNVEVFPVTLTGKQQTADIVVPVLCAPLSQRKARWAALFDVGAGMRSNTENATGSAGDAVTSCDIGTRALAVNDRAFEDYRLPGTPQLIADDGRPVPFSALTSDDALDAFMNTGH